MRRWSPERSPVSQGVCEELELEVIGIASSYKKLPDGDGEFLAGDYRIQRLAKGPGDNGRNTPRLIQVVS